MWARRRSKTGRQTLFVPEAGQQLVVLAQCVPTGSGVKIGSNDRVLCSHLSYDKMVIAREDVYSVRGQRRTRSMMTERW